jgi:hypothetical protein
VNTGLSGMTPARRAAAAQRRRRANVGYSKTGVIGSDDWSIESQPIHRERSRDPRLLVEASPGFGGTSTAGRPCGWLPKASRTHCASITRIVSLVTLFGNNPGLNRCEEVKFVCGQINARNSYGGYTGFSHFIVDERFGVFVESESRGR